VSFGEGVCHCGERKTTFPNSLPRPDDELDTLERVWQPLSGWSFITVVNNTYNSQWQTGLRPVESSYGAVVYTIIALQGVFVATVGVMSLYTLARSLCGLLNAERRATFDNILLLWHSYRRFVLIRHRRCYLAECEISNTYHELIIYCL
jgi:hypothetical protein